MRRLLAIVLLLSPLAVMAQEGQQESLPSGWKASPLPIVGYNTDLGFQFGAIADIIDYGVSPTLFPYYQHKLHFEISHYTGGQTLAHAEYDSSHLIPGIRFSSALSVQIDPLYYFYGFGGDITEYDRSIDRKNGLAFYSYKRNYASFQAAFQGNFSNHFEWAAGISFKYYKTSDAESDKYDRENTLYRYYRSGGIIRDNELTGSFIELKAGMAYDTRERDIAPTRGLRAELFLVGVPDFFQTGYGHLRLCANFRHFITPGPDWFTIAYKLAFQETIAGEPPFYMQQNIYSLPFSTSFSEGLGGPNTIRGLLNSRLVGDGYAWANLEMRFRIVQWSMLSADCYLGLNPFFDMGLITKPYRLDELAAATGTPKEELRETATRLHKSAGLGIKFGLADSFILSVEGAQSFSSNDGPFKISVAINYIF